MDLVEFAARVPGFDGMQPRGKIRLFGWFLHVHANAAKFDNEAIRDCFRKLGLVAPKMSVYLPRMAASKPPDLIRLSNGYQLARSVKLSLDTKYGAAQKQVAVTQLLTDLPSRVPDHAESVFLAEALNCYRVLAYRAASVMAWNLAFHHLLRWIMAEPQRLGEFNHAIVGKLPKRSVTIERAEDFEEFKEAEVIELCRAARLLPKNIVAILREKLTRRNIAAHPSTAIVTQGQADDTITDLVNNVVLALT
jgi:hypothetical protein